MAVGHQYAVGCTLLGGEAFGAAPGRPLLDMVGRLRERGQDWHRYWLMDRAYEDVDTRLLAFELGYSLVVPPKKDRKKPWDYDQLDIMFSAYIYLALALIAVGYLLPH